MGCGSAIRQLFDHGPSPDRRETTRSFASNAESAHALGIEIFTPASYAPSVPRTATARQSLYNESALFLCGTVLSAWLTGSVRSTQRTTCGRHSPVLWISWVAERLCSGGKPRQPAAGLRRLICTGSKCGNPCSLIELGSADSKEVLPGPEEAMVCASIGNLESVSPSPGNNRVCRSFRCACAPRSSVRSRRNCISIASTADNPISNDSWLPVVAASDQTGRFNMNAKD